MSELGNAQANDEVSTRSGSDGVEPETQNPTSETDAAAAAPYPILYDTNAEQRVQFHTERRGVMYPVAHIFGAGALKDEAILEYERAKDQRLTDTEITEADDRDAMAIVGQSFRAALVYYDKNCDRAEGYAGKVSEKDKVYAVNQLFGTGFDELPLAMGDQLCPEEDDDSSTYRMKCAPNGKLLITKHEMRAASSEEVSESVALASRTLLVQGTKFGQKDQRIPSKAKRWGELYDLMKIKAVGYVDKIPLHHKMSVVQRHLKSEQKSITGN